MARPAPIEIKLAGETRKVAPFTIDQIEAIEAALAKGHPTQTGLAKSVIGVAISREYDIVGASFSEIGEAMGSILRYAGFTPDKTGEGAGAPGNASTGSSSGEDSRPRSARRRTK